MKKIILCLLVVLLLSFAYAQQPKIEYFINDYANLLTGEQKTSIEPILKEIYDSGKAEYAIVIVNSLNGEDIEGYSYKLAEGKLGNKEKNNGLLLLIAVQDRQYRFEVGRGLEPELPDITMGRIGRNYLEPNFKQGDYATGITEASLAISDILLNRTDSNSFGFEYTNEIRVDEVIATFIIVLIIFLFIVFIIVKSSKNRKNGDYFFAGWILGELMKGGKGGFGGSGGFSGGGGFGGFGGGSFGGGGAGGHW
jgi:uncharacterized protein